MELEHTTVKEMKLLNSVIREQPVEFDVALPEYYPSVGRILRCFLTPTEEAVTFADGHVSVAGCASVRLLYADDENKLHCYRTEAKYTKILQTDVKDEQAAIYITQDVRTLNYRALGPKRVEIKANIAVKAMLFGVTQTQTITSAGENVQLRAKSGEYCEPSYVYSREFTEVDTVRCEAGGRKLKTLIAASAAPVLEKTESVPNKLMLRGKNTVAVLCADDEGGIGSYELSVPFSEVIDCYGIGENVSCCVMFTSCEPDVSLPEDGSNTFDISVRNQLLIVATQKQPLTCASDAYMLYGEAEFRFTELTPASAVSQSEEEERLSAEIEAYEDGGFAVRGVFVSDVSCGTDPSAEGRIDGTLCFNIIIADSENRLSLISKNTAFTHQIPVGDRCVICKATPKNAAGEALPGGKIAVSCTLLFQMLTQSGERVRMLTDVKVSKDVPVVRRERAVVYFAEKGETLWNIAKENKTSVAVIKAFNALASDVLESDAKLIFSCS